MAGPRSLAGGLALLVALVLGGCGGGGGVRTVELTVRHSRFLPAEVEVEPGETVRFVISNGDPIEHEFILGDEEVHARHADGTEAEHGAVPGEVSIAAEAVASTTYEFSAPGTLEFGCHLPGHWAYGMRGTVRVR